MRSSVHVDNKEKDILILGEGPTQGLNHPLIVEAKYPINFTQFGKRFVLNLHYYGSNSLLFVNTIKKYKTKAKDSEIKDYALFLGNVSKDVTINNMKKTGLEGVLNFLCVGFNPIHNNGIIDIHKYLIERL